MKKTLKLAAISMVAVLSLSAKSAIAEDYILTIKDHKFSPEEIEIPANQKVKITVKNLDSSSEEFESKDLKIEKIIAGNSEAKINIKPLKAGSYNFVGEFHEETAKGTIIVK